MKTILFMIITAITAGVLGWLYSPRSGEGFKNEQCYILLKSHYESDQGNEYVDSVITLSFLSNKGTITANTSLTTTDNITVPLMQRMDFTYDTPKSDEYTLKINGLMNSTLNELIPKSTTSYMKNILNVFLTNPKEIKVRIKKDKNGNFVMYNNVIPWSYCNRF